MSCAGLFAGARVQAIFDTAAQGNFVSTEYARRIGLTVVANNNAVAKAVNGTRVAIVGTAIGKHRLQGHTSRVQCCVADLGADFQLIFGEPWLQQHEVSLHYDTRTAVVGHAASRRATLRCAESVGDAAVAEHVGGADVPAEAPAGPQSTNAKVISAAKLQHMVRKEQISHVFAVHLSKEEGAEGPVSGDEVPSIQSELQALVREYTPSVFRDAPPPGLPPDRGIPQVIRLPDDTKAPLGPLYRMSPVELETLKRQIAELLEKGLIEPSTASFGAPCLFTTKKDTTDLRLVVDYRRLNALSEPDRGLLPRIDDAYTAVREARVFSAIDLTSGYHQISLPEEDVPKTSFRTPLGLFQFKVLPFGLRNAPQTFQAVMHKVLGPCQDYCLAYMDDVLVASRTPEEHVGHVRSVIERLHAERLYAKPRKCHWGKSRLRFLGHIVSADGLRVDPAKIAVVRDWATPQDVPSLTLETISELGFRGGLPWCAF